MIEDRNNSTPFSCETIESQATLYALDELDPAARAALESHAAQCSDCGAILAREARLHQVVASISQPADSLDRSGLLLAECRSRLSEAIDDHQGRINQRGWGSIFSPTAWWMVMRNTLVYHPAMTMAALVVISFMAGVAGQKMQVAKVPAPPRPAVFAALATPAPASPVTHSPTPKLTDQQLYSASSANVAWVSPSGSPTPTVQVQLMSDTPTSIVGSPEDADVERALLFVLENGQRFGPGARLESLDVLRTCAADPEVRRSLCAAARADQNPDVRMTALKSLQGYEQDLAVRQVVLDALQNDSNSAIRVEAINMLVNSLQAKIAAGPIDPQVVAVLRDRLRNDPNNYVRLHSAAALRALGSDAR